MSGVKIAADSGGGSVELKGPASTTSNAAVSLKLPVADGSANQLLKTDGSGNLGWATDVGGELVKIATVRDGGTASAITYDIDTTVYRAYNFIGAMKPATDDAYLNFYWRTSSADITATNYHYGSMYSYPDDNHYADSHHSQNAMELVQNAGNSTREGWRINLWLFPDKSGDAGTDISNYCTWTGFRQDSSANFRQLVGAGTYDAASTYPDGFTIKPNTGNFAAFTYSLYGLKV